MKKLLLTTALVAMTASFANAELRSGIGDLEDRSTGSQLSVEGELVVDENTTLHKDLQVNGDTRLGNHPTDIVYVNGELIIYDSERNPINLTTEFPALAATVEDLLLATGAITRNAAGDTTTIRDFTHIQNGLRVDSHLTVGGVAQFNHIVSFGGSYVQFTNSDGFVRVDGELRVKMSDGTHVNVGAQLSRIKNVINVIGSVQQINTAIDEVDNLNVTNTGGTLAGAVLSNTYEIDLVDQKIADQIASVTKLTERVEDLENGSSSGSSGSSIDTDTLNGLIDARVETAIASVLADARRDLAAAEARLDALEGNTDAATAQTTADNAKDAADMAQGAADDAQDAADQAKADAAAAQSTADKAEADAAAAQATADKNTADIATNAENIAENSENIAENAENISTNADDIATNANDIATNAAGIATNAGNIAVNAQNIAVNAENIAVNAEDIADNTDRILVDASELTALLATVEALTAKVANLEEVDLDTADRIKTLAAENEELTAAALAMSNAGAIATLEEQWKTDPVLGNIELDGLTGKVMHIEVRTGVYEERVARVEDIQTIADRVADNTSRIQLIENAIFVEHKESALVRMMKKLHSDAKIARENNTPFYALTSAGVVDLRGWKGSYTVGANQILIALDKALAYDVLGLSTVWVALK